MGQPIEARLKVLRLRHSQTEARFRGDGGDAFSRSIDGSIMIALQYVIEATQAELAAAVSGDALPAHEAAALERMG